MTLIEAFEKNLLNLGQPQKVIESSLAKLFFIEGKVYKVYKYEDNFAGKFSEFEYRRELYTNEFEWNSITSPDVYLSLKAVIIKNGQWIEVTPDQASDFYIIMNELSMDNNMIELLAKGELQDDKIKNIATYVENVISDLSQKNKQLLDSYTLDAKKNLENVLITSFSDWAKTFSSDNIDGELIVKVMKKLKVFFDSSSYFQKYDKGRLSVGLDNHAGNLFLLNGNPQYIDIYPPVKEYRITDKLLVVSVMASSISVFLGKDKSAIFYSTSFGDDYEKLQGIIDFYEMRYSLAQGMYYEKLNRPEISSKFFDYVRLNIDKF